MYYSTEICININSRHEDGWFKPKAAAVSRSYVDVHNTSAEVEAILSGESSAQRDLRERIQRQTTAYLGTYVCSETSRDDILATSLKRTRSRVQ